MHNIVPEIFMLEFHSEHYYVFRSARDHYQGTKPKQCHEIDSSTAVTGTII
jgi:hypothetical protein